MQQIFRNSIASCELIIPNIYYLLLYMHYYESIIPREFKTKYYSSYNDKIKIFFSIKKACTAVAIEQKPVAVFLCVFIKWLTIL